MPEEPTIQDPRDTEVRPRLVWGGIGLALVAVCLTGGGLMAELDWLTWGSAVLIVVGLLVAWRGGLLFDTRGQEPPHHEVREVVEGGTHEGVSPASEVVGPRAEAKAATVTERTEALLARSTAAPRRSLRTLGAFGLVALGLWLLLDNWLLDYPFTVVGQDSALRDVGFAVVLALSGLRLRLSSRSLLATGLGLLGGVFLVVGALALPHDSTVVRWNELLSGLAALVLVSLTFR